MSSDSLMAAMYKLMPKSLEESLMLRADEFESYESLFDRLVSYAGTKHSLSMRDVLPKREPRGANDMDVDALYGQGCGKGSSEKGKGPADGCWVCGGPHYASRCPYKGKSQGKGDPKGKGKAEGKAKGKGSKGKGKGKGRPSVNSCDDGWYGEPSSGEILPQAHHQDWQCDQWTHGAHNWEMQDGSASQTSWREGSVAQTTRSIGQPEPEANPSQLGGLDINAVDQNGTSMGKPPWIVNYEGDEWIRVNYDTGASTTAFPGPIAEGVPLRNVGKDFVVASGGTIPNYGRVRLAVQDEQGLTRKLHGSVTDVHKPFASGSEMARHGDTYLWDTRCSHSSWEPSCTACTKSTNAWYARTAVEA